MILSKSIQTNHCLFHSFNALFFCLFRIFSLDRSILVRRNFFQFVICSNDVLDVAIDPNAVRKWIIISSRFLFFSFFLSHPCALKKMTESNKFRHFHKIMDRFRKCFTEDNTEKKVKNWLWKRRKCYTPWISKEIHQWLAASSFLIDVEVVIVTNFLWKKSFIWIRVTIESFLILREMNLSKKKIYFHLKFDIH